MRGESSRKIRPTDRFMCDLEAAGLMVCQSVSHCVLNIESVLICIEYVKKYVFLLCFLPSLSLSLGHFVPAGAHHYIICRFYVERSVYQSVSQSAHKVVGRTVFQLKGA